MATKIIDSDIVDVYKAGVPKKKENYLATLFWGDKVEVVRKEGDYWKLDFTKREWDDASKKYIWKNYAAAISSRVTFREDPILKVRIADVGQGDAAIIESPGGKLVILDGGDTDNLKKYVSAAWAYVLKDKPLDCEAIVVTHGDADHFAGLTKLMEATRGSNKPMIKVKRIYHNGIVKGPSRLSTKEIFGKSEEINDQLYITELEDDIRNVPDSRMNEPFLNWKDALKKVSAQNGGLTVERLEYGKENAFDFLEAENIKVDILGPMTEKIKTKTVLPYLHNGNGKSYSESHTINGHSVVLRLTYGNVRFFFGADLNEEAEDKLIQRARNENFSLASEILKVMHHGSSHFNPEMLAALRPVVNIVSSGDESERTEYIHPGAGLMGALGKYSRVTVERPLIFVTELAAFFKRMGHVYVHDETDAGNESEKSTEIMNAYNKLQFGIVHVRTDGERVLAATHSGKPGQKESYRFDVDADGNIKFADKTVSL